MSVTPPFNIDHAAVNAMHMYVTAGVQIDALKGIEDLANELASALRDGKVNADLADALSLVSNEAAKAGTEAASYRERLERLQHACTAAVGASNSGK